MIKPGITAVALLLLNYTTYASEKSVQDIVNSASATAYYQGQDGKAQVKMTITDALGRERKREFTILRTDIEDQDNREQKYYVLFNRPSDVHRMVLMVWKNINTDDDRWLYLPALDLVKRIAANNGRNSFVGSHFYYEDVSGRNPNADAHALIEETDQYYIVESKPKKPQSVEFSRYITWIEKTKYIPIKTEFYDHNNEKYRSYAALKVENIEGWPTVVKASMEDHLRGGKTELTYNSIKYDVALPETIFTERYLRNPPHQYLH
ncbi:MAG TPA: outer membrane lipoprotein-sorting protein [Chromatiales bacterium]|nr:outer membrane lipoprotein-sorting protein [Thiotrichales bacterium]HIP67212.1 outer membrane lipoprotein-sorting protein [Chromatiales bacterium]